MRPRSASSTTPRQGPVRTTRRYLFDEFTDLMAGAAMTEAG